MIYNISKARLAATPTSITSILFASVQKSSSLRGKIVIYVFYCEHYLKQQFFLFKRVGFWSINISITFAKYPSTLFLNNLRIWQVVVWDFKKLFLSQLGSLEYRLILQACMYWLEIHHEKSLMSHWNQRSLTTHLLKIQKKHRNNSSFSQECDSSSSSI